MIVDEQNDTYPRCEAERLGAVPITLWVDPKRDGSNRLKIMFPDGDCLGRFSPAFLATSGVTIPKPPRVGPEILGVPMTEWETVFWSTASIPTGTHVRIWEACRDLVAQWDAEDAEASR